VNTVGVDEFSVAGREARTSNAREMSGEGAIGKMWSSGVPAGSPIVAVYSAYESDKDGEYNYLLGRKMGEDETVPSGMTQRVVEGGSYSLQERSRRKRWLACGGKFGRRKVWGRSGGPIRRISNCMEKLGLICTSD